MMNAAISWASLRLSGKFGIVACGRSRNEAIISKVTVSLAAMDGNDGALLYLPGVVPIGWHSVHHRSDSRRPLATSCAKVASPPPMEASATKRHNAKIRMDDLFCWKRLVYPAIFMMWWGPLRACAR